MLYQWGTDSSVGFRQVDMIHSSGVIIASSVVPGGSNRDIAANSRFGMRWLALP